MPRKLAPAPRMIGQKKKVEEPFEMLPEEVALLQEIHSDRRFLESEMRNLSIREHNLFLMMQLRTGIDVQGWVANSKSGLCGPTLESTEVEEEEVEDTERQLIGRHTARGVSDRNYQGAQEIDMEDV